MFTMTRGEERGMAFTDRTDAGKRLAETLTEVPMRNPIVLALPRGGVVVGYEVALALGVPLDVVVARKIGAPEQPELAIGAIAPEGVLYLDERIVNYLGIELPQIQETVEREREEMERRIRSYRGDLPFPDLMNRTVLLIDDGLATGATARAAIRYLRKLRPLKIVLAAPVCAKETAYLLRMVADEVASVLSPVDLRSVGAWYDDFDQTTDEEVIELLRKARSRTDSQPNLPGEEP
jgi:predicted phosphoribosyltransferase